MQIASNVILGSRQNWLNRSDIHVFVNFTKKLKAGLE